MILLFENCIRVGQQLLFVCTEYNILCSLDIISGEVAIVSSIPGAHINRKRLSSKIILWKDSLFLTPLQASNIWKYNLTDNNWEAFERKKFENWTSRQDMAQAVVFNKKIFFIGCLYPAIIVMDPYLGTMNYITGPFDEKKELASKARDIWFRTDYVIKDGYMYLASCIDNAVLCFDLNTYSYEYIHIGEEGNTFSGIGWDGEFFYLAPRKSGPIVIWDGKEVIEKIELKNPMLEETKSIGNAVCFNNKIVFPGVFSPNTIELVKNDGFSVAYYEKQFLFYEKVDDETLVSLDNSGSIEIIWQGAKYSYKMELSEKQFWKYCGNNKEDLGISIGSITKETNIDSLCKYINII